MSKEALKLALEALEEPHPGVRTNFTDALKYREKIKQAITALREALARQGPVPTECRRDGRCQHVIDLGLEGQSLGFPLIVPAEQEPDRVRELECVIADLKAECQELRAAQPAQQEFVSPGGGYVPAIPAQQRPIKTFHGGKAWPVQEPAQQEPVCPKCGNNRQVWDNQITGTKTCHRFGCHSEILTPQPAQRKPLTDDEIWREYRFLWPFHPAEERKLASDILMFARAIEAAHGIKENT